MDTSSFGTLTALGLDGAPVQLGTLYQDRPAVLIFLRHFGWLHCAQQAAEFRAHQSEIESLGARLVFIGNGNPAQAQHFRTNVLHLPEQPAPGEPLLLTDPSLVTFKAAGMKHGRLRTFAPSAAGPTLRALKEGFRQSRTMGEPWQQGGALVFDKGGAVRFSYSSDDPGDHPPLDEVLAALRPPAAA